MVAAMAEAATVMVAVAVATAASSATVRHWAVLITCLLYCYVNNLLVSFVWQCRTQPSTAHGLPCARVGPPARHRLAQHQGLSPHGRRSDLLQH